MHIHDFAGGGISLNNNDYFTIWKNVVHDTSRKSPYQEFGISVWQPHTVYNYKTTGYYDDEKFHIKILNNISYHNYTSDALKEEQYVSWRPRRPAPLRIAGALAFAIVNGDDSGNFDYIAGVEVSDFSDLPREFARVRIPAQRYVVFRHTEHVSTIRRTFGAIWNHGFRSPDSRSRMRRPSSA